MNQAMQIHNKENNNIANDEIENPFDYHYFSWFLFHRRDKNRQGKRAKEDSYISNQKARTSL
jgi:hypothetical protein